MQTKILNWFEKRTPGDKKMITIGLWYLTFAPLIVIALNYKSPDLYLVAGPLLAVGGVAGYFTSTLRPLSKGLIEFSFKGMVTKVREFPFTAAYTVFMLIVLAVAWWHYTSDVTGTNY